MKNSERLGAGFLLFLAILFVIPFAVATPDIDVVQYSPSYEFFTGAYDANPEVCICSTYTDTIKIQNTGMFGAVFTITTNQPQYVTVPINSIQLEAGQEVDVQLIVNAPCDTREQKRMYDVTVSSNLGRQKVISRSLSMNRCQSIVANLYADKDKVMPCKMVNYTIELENPSTFEEEYIIDATRNRDLFSVPRFQLFIPAGKKGTVNTLFNATCTLSGNVTNSFLVKSVNNKLSTVLKHELYVDANYAYELNVNGTQNVCLYENRDLPITIKNLGTVDNTYRVSLVNAPSYLYADTTEVTVKPGKSATISIFSPALNDEQGAKFRVRVESQLGKIVQEREISYWAGKCFVLEPKIIDAPLDLCSGDVALNAIITNKGYSEESISLTVEADVDASLSDSSFILKPEEQKTVRIELEIDESDNGRSVPVKLNAYVSDKGLTRGWSDSVTFTAHDQNACTRPSFDRNLTYARFTDSEISFMLTNAGYETASYKLIYEGSDWLSLPERELTLNAGESKPVRMTLYSDESDAQREYDFNITVVSWENGEQYTHEFTLIMTDTPFIEKALNYISQTTCRSVMLALGILIVIAFIVFVVKFLDKRSKHWVPARIKVLGAALIVLIIVLTIVAFGAPKSIYPEKQASDALTITWYEDQQQKVDLASYFNDPDDDVLTYTVDDQPENILVLIEGSEMLLMPDKDWSGTRRARFTATDAEGESATSPSITLNVIDVPDMDLLGYLDRYCAYINALLLIILILIVYFTPFSNAEDAAKRKGVEKVYASGIKKDEGYLYFVDKEGDISRSRMKRRAGRKKRR